MIACEQAPGLGGLIYSAGNAPRRRRFTPTDKLAPPKPGACSQATYLKGAAISGSLIRDKNVDNFFDPILISTLGTNLFALYLRALRLLVKIQHNS